MKSIYIELLQNILSLNLIQILLCIHFSIRALDHFTERLISFEPVYDGCVKNLNNLCDIKIHTKEAEYSSYSDIMIDQYIEVLNDAKEFRRKVAHYLDENFGVSLFFG